MLGMSVAREWRGEGLGTRLLEHAIQWARETGIVTRIELFVFARNTGAIRLYERFGFVIEGRRRRSVYKDEQYMDDLLMALLL
jgi:RimJ/RimL family protein N-acetyltransferase